MSSLLPPETVSPRSHQEWAVRVWRRLDRDMSGFITNAELECEEFHRIIRSILAPHASKTGSSGGPTYARAKMNASQVVEFCVRKSDLNNDGKLSFAEFESLVLVLRQHHLAQYTANLIFALFDVNKDQRISIQEFREVYRFFLGHNPTEEDFQHDWEQLVSTGLSDVEVTREQYCRWLQTATNPVFHQHAPGYKDQELASPLKEAAVPVADDLEQEQASEPESPTRDAHLSPASSRTAFRSVGSSTGPLPRSNFTDRTIKRTWSTGSVKGERPKWNQRFNNEINLSMSPKWHPNDDRSQGERYYFSRPSNEREIEHFYSRYRGFGAHKRRLRIPPKPLKRGVLSSEGGTPVMMPERHVPGGSMRDWYSSEVVQWESLWQTPLRYSHRLNAAHRPWAPRATFSEPSRIDPRRIKEDRDVPMDVMEFWNAKV